MNTIFYKNSTVSFSKKFSTFVVGAIVIASFIATPVQTVFAERMTSGSYIMESDSVNFEGARSTSASYSLEDTGGEIATGDSSSTNSNLNAGFQQAAVVAETPEPSPETTPSSSSSSGSVPYPVNVLNFTATPLEKSIALSWIYPQTSNIVSVRIVRSDKFFPNDISDGEVIFEGTGAAAIDHDVVVGTQYYYALFAKNSLGEYSSGVLAQARIAPVGDVTPPLTPGEIFENIPLAENVDPIISALTLLDLDFIQNGRKISQNSGIIAIDGKENLTIRLDYNKVPEVLKTIAISLSDPEDSTKVFSFLLRVNKDKTAYEATIAPLGRGGDYKLNAIVLDYQNQGLKRLNGNLRAFVLDEGQNLFGLDGKNPSKLWLMIVFLVVAFGAIILLVVIERRKKEKKKKEAEAQNINKTLSGLLMFFLVFVQTVVYIPNFNKVAHAAVNPEINYQGKLFDSSGDPVSDGTYSMVFNLYTTSSGGSTIWTESRTGGNVVQVTDGLFSILLGGVSSLSGVDFNQTLYLGVTIGSDSEMTPRKKLGTVPAAFVADTLDGLDSTQFLRSDATNATGIFTNVTITNASTTNITIAGNLYDSTGSAGNNGQVLKISGGVPVWGTDLSGSGGGSEINWTYFNGSGVYVSTTTNQVLIGDVATTSNQKLEVRGGGYFSGNLGLGTTTPYAKLSVDGRGVFNQDVRANYFTSTSTSNASTFPYASTTVLTASLASTSNLIVSNTASIGTLTGLLYGTSGSVGTIATSTFNIALSDTTGTLAVNRGGTGLGSYTLGDVLYASGATTLAGTSTANLKTTLGLNNVENTALSTWAGSTNLITLGTIATGIWNGTIIGDAFITKTGAWTGTFDGQEGSYYLDARNQTNFGTPFYQFFSATTTSALAEGLNMYWTNDRFDARLAATTTLPNLTTLLGLTDTITTRATTTQATTTNLYVSSNSGLTVGTLNGPLQANNGIVSATTSIGVTYGGTGASSFGQGWIYSSGGTGALSASTSPTINYLTATSTATSTFAGSLAVTEANATSTFAGGIDLSDGCFAIDGVCLGGSSYSDTNVNAYIHASSTIPKTYTTNTFTADQIFSGKLTMSYASSTGISSSYASTSNLIVSNTANFTSASTTALTISQLYDSAGSRGSNGMVLQTNGSVATWVSTSTLGLGGSGGGSVTSVTAGSGLTGGEITSSGTIALDLTSANIWTGLQRFNNASSTRFSVFDTAYFGGTATSTFNSAGVLTLASALAAGSGGTGISNPTAAGVLVGSYAGGGWQQIATSSLGITSSQWTTNGSNIYYNSGNVSIGTTTSPSNAFTVLSTTQPQFRLAYDTSNYFTSSVNSLGSAAFSFNGASSSLMLNFAQPAITSGSAGLSATTSLLVIGATGGNSSNGDDVTAGAGGGFIFSGGAGGIPTVGGADDVKLGGAGGAISITSGTGGSVTLSNTGSGQNIAGAGGVLNLIAGSGGNASSAVGTNWGGTGGVVTISAGAGGNGDFQGNGGNTFIAGGRAGTSGTAGNVYLGATSTSVARGNIYFGARQGIFNTTTGLMGLGTTSPYAKLSVVGQVVGAYFTATTSTASTFPYASSTAITVSGTASTTNLIVSNSAYINSLANGGVAVNSSGQLYSYATSTWTFASSTLLADSNTFSGTNTFNALTIGSLTGPLQAVNGVVSASSTLSIAYGGTGTSTAPSYGRLLVGNSLGGYDYVATSSLGLATFGYLFPSNATSTLLSFTGGLTSYASTTIGNGTAAGGLTVSGNATTTGTLTVLGTASTSNLIVSNPAATSTFAGNVAIGANVFTSNNSFASGLVSGSGSFIEAQGSGSFATGRVATVVSTAQISATGTGAFAGGSASGTAGGRGQIKSTGTGSLAYGSSDGSSSNIFSTNSGSVALGYAGTGRTIQSSGPGSFAIGQAFIGNIAATNSGSFAGGYAGAGLFSSLTPGTITASGYGSFAFGDNLTASGALSTAFGSSFTNSTDNSFMVGYSSTPTLTVRATGVGIATTSPWRALSVNGSSDLGNNALAGYFTATTSTASTFPYASSTAITVSGTASTSNLIVSNTANLAAATIGSLSGLLYGTNGSVGTIATSSLGLATFSYLFPSNATSTLLSFTGGLTSYASTTIGGGTQTTGLTVNGGATTTGNAYFTGNIVAQSGFRLSSLNCDPYLNDGKLTTDSLGNVICADDISSAGGGSGGTWSTTTSSVADQYVNYSNSNVSTDIVTVGGSATTTAKFWFDPFVNYASLASGDLIVDGTNVYTGTGVNFGVGTSSPFAKLSVAGIGSFDDYVRASYFTATSTATSTFAGSIAVTEANATSTFAGGIDLSDGCFAVDGVCLGGSSYGDTSVNAYIHASSTIPKTYTNNTFTGTNIFSALTIGSLTGPLQAVNGVVSASSTLSIAYGGTGTSTAPSYGRLLVGNSLGGYDYVATSSLGITSSQWTTNGSNIYYNSGNVSIGTTTSPSNAFTVLSTTQPQMRLAYDTSNYFTSSVNSLGSAAFSFNGASSSLMLSFAQPAITSGGAGLNATTSLLVIGATGGNSSNADSAVGGTGGGFNFFAGEGGRPTQNGVQDVKAGGGGGTISLVSGRGGDATVTNTSGSDQNVGGAGGALNLVAGAGGNASSADSTNRGGNGGSVIVSAGDGGHGLSTGGNGGNAFIAGGRAGSVGTAGNVYLGATSTTVARGNVYFGAQQGIFNTTTGFMGLGTTSPYAKLSVVGQVVGAYFTATTSTASTFPYASSTAITVSGTASTSNLIVSGNAFLNALSNGGVAVNSSGQLYSYATSTWTFASSTLLADNNTFSGTNTFNALTIGSLTGPLQAVNGVVSASSTLSIAYGGTGTSTAPSYGRLLVGNSLGGYDYVATSSLGLATFGYLFPSNATSTLLSFNGGLTSYASTTIGGGTQTTGLTVNGGATTTGNAYFGGHIGVGTSSATTVVDITNSGTSLASYLLNVHGVKYSGGDGVNGMGINLSAAPGADSGSQNSGESIGGSVTISSGNGGLGTAPSNSGGAAGSIQIAAGAGGSGSGYNGNGGTVYITGGVAGAGAGVAARNGNVILGLNSSGTVISNIAIGTTSPYAKLSVWNSGSGRSFEVVNSASTTNLWVSATGFGTTTVTGLNISGSATSTSNVGFNLSGGCYAIGGVCLSSGTSYTDANTNAYIHASSTIAKTYTDNTFTGANIFGGITTFNGAGSFTNGLTANTLTIGSLTGPLQAVNGVVSASSTLSIAYGGTGTSTAPSYGRLLVGNSLGGYDLVATSSLGLGSGTGTVNEGTLNRLSYYTGATAVSSANFLSIDASNSYLGIGTSTPYSKLSVWGAGTGTNRLFELTNSASTTLASVLENGTAYFLGNVGIGTTSPYAKLSVAGQIVGEYFTATSTTATSTFAGSVNIGNGAIVHDASTGTTSISYLEAGNMNFAADSGVISWIDMPVTSASANGVVNSYSANLNGNSLLTIYGVSNGSGSVTNTAVGIGTTSPAWKLSVAGNGSFDDYVRASYFVATSSTASVFPYASSTALTVSGTASTSNLIVSNSTYLTGLSAGGVGVTSSGLLYNYATSTWTFASSTLLADNNTFSGTNVINLSKISNLTGNGFVKTSGSDGTLSIDTNSYALSSDIFGYLFPSNATSTLLSFNGGLTSYASTTIGGGTQTTGLTISGGATTTGNAYFAGNVGIGTTSPYAALSIHAGATSVYNPTLFAVGSSTAAYATSTLFNVLANGNVGVGTSSPFASLAIQGKALGYGSNLDPVLAVYGGGGSVYGQGIILQAGEGQTAGGDVKIYGGNFSTSDGNGGAVRIGAGQGGTQGVAGNTYIDGGVGNSGTNGNILLSTVVSGKVGIGTTSPYAKLSVDGRGVFNQDVRANYFTATSTSVASTFPYASTTAITVSGTASTTNLIVSGSLYNSLLADGCLNVASGLIGSTGSACGAGGGGTFSWTPTTNYGALANATATPIWFQNGLMASSTSYFSYASTTALSVSGNAYFPGSGIWNSSGFVGIGTTSPYAKLSVAGQIVGEYFTATSTTATSTFAGGLNVGEGGFVYDWNTGVTSIGSLETGAFNFDTDAGQIAWADLPVSSSAVSGLVQSYTAMIDSNPLLTLYGVSTGTGEVRNLGVGIGSTSPSALLTIENGAFTASSTYSLHIASTTAAGAWASHFAVMNNGNVGIGTSSPYAKLSVAGQILGDYFTATSTTATSTFAGGLNVGGGNFMYDLDSGVTSASSFQTGNLNFDTDAGLVSWADLPLSSAAAGTAQGYTAYLNGSSTISVYGLSAGSGWLQGSYPRVSIGDTSTGTSTPSSRLTVFGSGTGTGGLFELVDSASTTRMRVLDNGNVGIGTTSPWRTLSATGTVAFAGLTVAGASGDALCLSASYEVVVNTGAQTCTVSSARFKDNITPLSGGLDTVLKLNPVSYVYKGTAATASSTDGHLGLVAEEVYAIEPRLVFLGSDGLPRGVRYEEVTSVLTKAIQEQQGQIGSIASSTLVLDSKNKELSDLLVTNLASSSQSNKDLAKALDLSNTSIISLGSQIDLLTADIASTSGTLSVLTASVGDLDGRVQSLESLFGDLSATSTFITQIASSTALVLASTTADILASSTPFLSRVFDGFMEFLTTATTRVKGIFVQELHVEDKLCVDDVCINKDQLKALLVQAGGTSASSTPIVVVPPAAPTPVVPPESVPTPTPAPVVDPTPSATPASSTPQVTEPTSDSSASSTPATTSEPAPESTPPAPAPESQPAETPAPTEPETIAESTPESAPAPAPEPAPAPAPEPTPTAASETPVIES